MGIYMNFKLRSPITYIKERQQKKKEKEKLEKMTPEERKKYMEKKEYNLIVEKFYEIDNYDGASNKEKKEKLEGMIYLPENEEIKKMLESTWEKINNNEEKREE